MNYILSKSQLMAVPLLLLVVAAAIFAFGGSNTPTASGHASPVGCNANNLVLGFARSPATTQQGATVEYRILARNNTSDDPLACDITGADISFTEPALDGTATGTTHILANNVSLPADGSGDLCFRSSTAPASLACPAGTTEVIDDDLSYVTNVNPGVTSIVVAARVTGNRPPTDDCPNGAATLHDSDTESDACAAQTLTNGVVNALIRLTPPTATNEVGTTHDITCTILVHNGGTTTFVNAPDGTLCDADIDSGPGSFVGDDDDCLVDGGDGNCIITITSNITGTTVVSACTEENAPPGGLTVNEQVLSRCTDGLEVAPGESNGDPVEKVWVDSRISIAPNGTNAVGDTHTFTCTVEVDEGSGFGPAPDGTECEVSIVSGPGTITGSPCSTVGGSCTVTADSDDPGLTEVQACAEIVVDTVTMNRCTDAISPSPTTADCQPSPVTILGAVPVFSSVNALKCWVDARITITPNGTNAVDDTHTFTCTVEVDQGSGFGPAPDGTQCEVSIVSGPGSITGSPCSTVGGSCTVDADSAVTGLSEVQACADVTILGVQFTNLCTEAIDPAPTSEDCEPTPTTNLPGVNALKCWVDARISLTPDGTNEVDDTHTFTCTIEVDLGSGFEPAPDDTECEVSILSGPGTITGSPCLTVAGSCDVDDDSSSAGLDEVEACTTFTLLGVTFTDLCTEALASSPTTEDCVATPTPTPLGSNALKCWVDARISITPNGTNQVNDPHTFTCTIDIDTGSGFAAAPDGTECEVSITNGGPGTITGSPCSTVSGSCTVTDNSASPGIDEVQACTEVIVLGVTLNRCTTDITNPTEADCEPTPTATTAGENAVKCWEQPPAGGCTPGFWKTHPTEAVWGPTGYDPDQSLESVFDVPNSFGLDNDSLLTALGYPGGSGTTGSARILLRAAVAAILNSSHPDVGSVYGSTAEIIADVNAALASNNRNTMLTLARELDIANNEGCTIDAHGDPIDD